MNCCCQLKCDNLITQLTNISKVWKGEFFKTAEVNFYVKSKKVSELKVRQFTDVLFGRVCEQLNLIIEVTNLGTDIESSGKLIDILPDENNLNINSITLTKGTYTLENGIFIWDIGQIAPEEQLFAIISFKPEKNGLYKSIAMAYGNNYDPCLCNNFSIEKIPVIDSCLETKLIIIMIIIIAVLILLGTVWHITKGSEEKSLNGDGDG